MTSRQGKGKWMATLAAMLLGQAAFAQETGYGCRDLLTSRALPAVEGDAGQFFRVDPDLMALNRIPDAAIDDLAALTRALDQAGVTLIYVPTPTKALAAPQYLPPLAGHLGYDADLAVSVHDEMLKAMRAAGVRVVDARAALQRAGQDKAVFHGPDPRPNRDGQIALAEAVAQRVAQTEGFGALPKTPFVTLEGADQPIPSITRFRLQQNCQADLPQVTGRLTAVQLAPGGVAGATRPRVALISSDMTGDPRLNFAPYLAEALSLEVEAHHVPGGNAFDAIAAYMTSRAFGLEPPRYLIWENPVWQSLGAFGDQPIAELMAAATGCEDAVKISVQGGRISLDPSGLPVSDRLVLGVDTASDVIREARFHMLTPEGLTRTRSIRRAEAAPLTGRFFMPLSGHDAVPNRIEIEFDGPLGPEPTVIACHMEAQR